MSEQDKLCIAYLAGEMTYEEFDAALTTMESDEAARIGGGCDRCFEGCSLCAPAQGGVA